MREGIKEITLHIDPQQPFLQMDTVRLDQTVSTKQIPIDSLIDMIRSSIQTPRLATGFLPPLCLQAIALADGWNIAFVSMLNHCPISYHETIYPDFPLPRMVISCTVSTSGKLFDFKLCVTENTVDLSPKTILYHYPFSNVNNFSLCVGANSFHGYDKLQKLRSLPYRLMTIPNNDDLYSPEHNRLEMPFRELLTHLQDKDTAYYYEHILIPSGKTLQDFLTAC